MSTETRSELYQRPYAEVKAIMLERAQHQRNPFEHVPLEQAREMLDRLDTLDPEVWAATWSAEAVPAMRAAAEAEAAGDCETALRGYLHAYGLFRLARFPAPNCAGKRAAYVQAKDAYLKAARFFNPPLEQVQIPYVGRQAPGAAIVAYLRKPKGSPAPLPIVVTWGGIDAFKEERRADPFLRAGIAVLAMDMPGVGEAPIAGSEDGEELWDGVLDWIAAQPDLDARRVAVVGGSTGGYWATKLAHTHRERISAAVNHGGCAHLAFQADWITRASRGEYAWELAETLASAHGRATAEEWIGFAPSMSLLEQGWLDKPCAPLLLLNGIHDSVFPIEDMYLLLRHGSPKSARFFDTGHMGHGPELLPTMVGWITDQLCPAMQR